MPRYVVPQTMHTVSHARYASRRWRVVWRHGHRILQVTTESADYCERCQDRYGADQFGPARSHEPEGSLAQPGAAVDGQNFSGDEAGML